MMIIGNRKYETQQVLKKLLDGKRGDIITTAEMEQIVGRPCWAASSTGYSYVRSAMEAAMRDHQVFWYRDKNGQRYVCGDVDDCNRASRELVAQSGRRARKSLRVASCVKSDEMNDTQRQEHNLNAILAGLIVNAASTPARKKLAGKVTQAPDTDDLLRLLVPGQ